MNSEQYSNFNESEGPGDRFGSKRDWARQQGSVGSSKFTASSGGGENPWGTYVKDVYYPSKIEAGKGAREKDPPRFLRRNRKGSKNGSSKDLHDLPPPPYKRQLSAKSGMSNDLSGFSDFDLAGKSITAPHPAAYDAHVGICNGTHRSLATIAGTGAAAAAAAEATNARAEITRQQGQRATASAPVPSAPVAETAETVALSTTVTASAHSSLRTSVLGRRGLRPARPSGATVSETKEENGGAGKEGEWEEPVDDSRKSISAFGMSAMEVRQF